MTKEAFLAKLHAFNQQQQDFRRVLQESRVALDRARQTTEERRSQYRAPQEELDKINAILRKLREEMY